MVLRGLSDVQLSIRYRVLLDSGQLGLVSFEDIADCGFA